MYAKKIIRLGFDFFFFFWKGYEHVPSDAENQLNALFLENKNKLEILCVSAGVPEVSLFFFNPTLSEIPRCRHESLIYALVSEILALSVHIFVPEFLRARIY